MRAIQFPKVRFNLKSLLVLILGIALGYALNTWSVNWRSESIASGRTPPYVIEPPDIVSVVATSDSATSLSSASGQHLVGPDGRINVGEFGSIYLAGMTLDEARTVIEKQLTRFVQNPKVAIDVFASSSKTYYVIMQNDANNHTVEEFPITGNDTVLDALANVKSAPASAKLWIARRLPNGTGDRILPIEWRTLVGGASPTTNYALFPRDRLFISKAAETPVSN